MVKRISGRALKPPSVTSSQPLRFEFYYGKQAASTEMNTVYLDDGNPKVDLNLEVFNESSGTITFHSGGSKLPPVGSSNSANEANEARCHFYLTFAKDLNINPQEIEIQDEQKNHWQVNFDEDSQFTTLYFLRKEQLVLQAKNPENTLDRILLIFKNFAARNSLVKTSNVKLTYGSELLSDGQNTPFTRSITVNNAISVTNHPENNNIPLQVRCVGPNTILNDGTSQNTLKLQIVNSSLSANRPNLLLDKANSKFIVSFETGDRAEALTILNNVNNGTVTATDTTHWMVDKTPNQAEWTVKLKSSSTKTKLVDKETIELNISNLVTSNPSGVAYLYITYQNIGTYPDGQLLVPIEKTPLLYREAKVGIGTTSPNTKLEIKQTGRDGQKTDFISFYNDGGGATQESRIVWRNGSDRKDAAAIASQPGSQRNSGDLRFQTGSNGALNDRMIIQSDGKVGIGTTTPKIHLAIGDDDTGFNQEADGKLAIYTNNAERVRIDENGNVGIGTKNPSAKLHVGGDAIVSGKVGIAISTLSANAAPKIHLAIGDDDTGLHQKGDGELAIYTNNAERVRINKNGNVGIGTTEPTHRLHIAGKNSTLRLGGEGTHGVGAKLNFGDGEQVYITEDEDKKLLIHADTRISLDSNVGIGTTNPSAKLDVNGSVKLGDGSTAWNRIICGKVIVQPGVSETEWKYYGKGISRCIRTAETGLFNLYFEKAVDPQKMVITVSTEYSYADNFVSVIQISSDCFVVQTRDVTKQKEDASFHFIAIELAENYNNLLNA